MPSLSLAVAFLTSLTITAVGYGQSPAQSISPAECWKKADNWQIQVELFPRGGKGAGVSSQKREPQKPYSLFVSIVGDKEVGESSCWKVFFIPEQDKLTAIGNMYCVLVDKASTWPRKVIRVKDPSAATIEILEKGAWISGAPVGFPLECFPLLGLAKFGSKDTGAALQLERQVNGKDLLLEAKFNTPDGGESVVRQKWVEGEKWWREYDRWVNGQKDLHASRILPPAQSKTASSESVSPPSPWLQTLFQDPKLQATLSLRQIDPPLPEIFQKLEEARCNAHSVGPAAERGVRPTWSRKTAMESMPIREIKPVVVPAQYFVWAPLIAGFISFLPAFFTVFFSLVGTDWTGDRLAGSFKSGLAVFAVCFVLLMVLLGIKAFQEPRRTSYMVFPDRIEYDEGHWNRHRRTAVFDQVIEVELTEGLLQRTSGAGTVTLITQQLVSGSEGQLSNRRIALSNVPEPRAVYELIRSLALSKQRA
jgi:hypothetical protein